MPFTPFHFGPGVMFKALAPGYYSFTVFLFTQIVIDLEPLYFMLHGEWPIHRFFHTYLGATVVSIIGITVGRPLCGVLITITKQRLRVTKQELLLATNRIKFTAALSGAFIGSYSHVALDSIMHSDVKPFAQFSEINPLLNAISSIELHLYCATAGIFGIIGMGFWWLVRRDKLNT